MTRHTPGHERLSARSPQGSALSTALVAAIARGPQSVPTAAEHHPVLVRRTRPAGAIGCPAPASAGDTPIPDEISELWGSDGGPRDRTARDRLVAHYSPLVRGVATRMVAGMPGSVESADLVQAGIFGLLDAIARYDAARGIRFETYAAQRIRGAMLDELRSQDWVPRTVRGRVREVERARERLECVLRRAPRAGELAAELGVSTRELRRISQYRRLVSVEALDDPGATAGPEGLTAADSLADDSTPDPVAVVALRETRRELSDAVRRLDERDRLVVHFYYVENRTLAEIGALLGVTESRVCQLHSRLVARLRARMEELAAG